MTTLLEKVAGVLEAIADDIDNNSYVSTPLETAATNDAGEAEVSKLAHAYAQATGEAPSEEVLSELQANEAFKSTILKVAAQSPSDLLGGPSDKTASSAPEAPLRGEAAVIAARNKFGQAILAMGSHGE